MLSFAKSLGDFLIVGIDSDKRIKETKGILRPANSQSAREEVLRSLKSVDSVVVFSSEEDLAKLICEFQPAIMVVGAEYKNKRVIGAEHVDDVCFFERIEPYSTTRIINGGYK